MDRGSFSKKIKKRDLSRKLPFLIQLETSLQRSLDTFGGFSAQSLMSDHSRGHDSCLNELKESVYAFGCDSFSIEIEK
jgi:hypothetical protein